MLTRFLVLAVVCLALPALAEDDDDLAPIAPSKAKPKAVPVKAKAPPPAKAKAPPVVKAKQPAAPLADDDDLAPIGLPKGELVVKVMPATVTGAVVLVDGKEVGAAAASQSVAPGEHTVTVKRPGFATFVKKVIIAASKTLELEAKLTPTFAVLTVSSDVPEAQVLINGKLIGTTPIAEREWPAGPCEITIRKEGYKEDKQAVTFVAGRDYPISIKFKPAAPTVVAAAPTPVSDRPVETNLAPSTIDQPVSLGTTASNDTPVYGRWYFWVGVGAVVAAGVGIGLAVVQPGAAPRPLQYQDICKAGKCPDACINIVCPARYGNGGAPMANGITF